MSATSSPAEIVLREVRRWLVLADDLLPVLPLAVAVANRLPGPPVWAMIVAPPASGKSEVIQGVSALRGARAISSLTSKTFASGMLPSSDGSPPRSLLDRLLQQGKWLLTIKDFGTIQSLPPFQRNPIYGQLREIYDGKYNATYGTGVEVDWRGKLGLLVAATPAVDRQHKWSAELGERFVQFRPLAPDPTKVAAKAILVTARDREKQAAIMVAYRRAFQEAEAQRKSDKRYTKANQAAQQLASALALFTVDARRGVLHDRYSGGYQVLPPEGPGRLVKVLIQLYVAGLICYAGDCSAAARLVCRIARDSMPGRRSHLLREIARCPTGLTASTGASLLECDQTTAGQELNDLVVIGLATKSRPAQTDIYLASNTLLRHAETVFPSESDSRRALEKLFDLGRNSTSEREREEEGE